MNRFKKEEKKRKKAREGLTPDQIKALDAQEEKEEEVSALASYHRDNPPQERCDNRINKKVDVSSTETSCA